MRSILLITSSVVAFSTVAAIYKYQDEQGHWYFTDKPQAGDVVEEKRDKVDKEAPKLIDLKEILQHRFKPNTPTEAASLAVVAIETPMGEGSGFFISEHGHILTNKHVIKPTETKQWKQLEDNLREADEAYRESDRSLRNEKRNLESIENSLRNYKKAIDRADDGYAKRIAQDEYNLFMNRYQEHERKYREVLKKYSENKRKYDAARSEFNILSATSILARNFKIILKDGEELTAYLITVSDKYDLALLKIDHHKTPYIEIGNFDLLHHGIKVFAIGSPLGMKDVITSGVVAGIKDNNVITDATVLPGSSGGPLLTADGKVIGVTSQRVSQVIGGEGLGVAISIDTAISEFKDQIGNK
jgi:S1-C subfamily serine protease